MRTPVFEHLPGDVVCIDALYTAPAMACCYLIRGGDEWAFVETGTSRSLANILATIDVLGIEAAAVRYVIPTHVHLDHAGGAGALMQQFHNAELLVHPRGARHMIEPAKLVASAKQVYGETLFTKLYGDILPVESSRVRTLEDGETIELGDRRLGVRHTRGHAEHHFCLFDERTRGWFSGDMFGVSYATLRFEGGAYVMPATTPTQFEPALYAAAVRDLAAAAPSVMYLTHFSALDFAPDQADSLCRQLDAYATLGERCADEPGRLESEILAISRQELERMLPPKQAMEAASRLTMDAKLNAQGIAWWQQARTGAGG